MQTNIDDREIIQTVTPNVLQNAKQQLTTLEPDVIVAIVKQVEATLLPTIDSLVNQVNDLQWRMDSMDQNVGTTENNLFTTTTPDSQQTSTPTPKSKKRKVKPKPNITPKDSTLLMLIENWVHFRYKGWIFYRHEGQSNDIYMVREDGTENTCINTNYYVTKFVAIVENGQDWIVKFIEGSDKKNSFAVHMP